MKDRAEEIIEVVDEFTDDLNPPRLEQEAERLGITVDDLLQRIQVEVKTRLS